MKRKVLSYSSEELDWIKANATLPRAEAYAKFIAEFGRTDITAENYAALCKRRGWLTGRDGRLKPGNIPWSKGKKLPYNANSAKTQFKKGQHPHNIKYAGHERLHEDGYLYISVEETNPHTGFERRYLLKHKYLWEKKNGAVPEGMCLKCVDGNRQNCDPSNWTPISRGELPHLNGRWSQGYDESPDEVKPVLLTLAKLKHAKGAVMKQQKD
jgi:HNH endonuclease